MPKILLTIAEMGRRGPRSGAPSRDTALMACVVHITRRADSSIHISNENSRRRLATAAMGRCILIDIRPS
jgi:hypothetical protein